MLRIASVFVAALSIMSCGESPNIPTLQGRWVGNYAMSPAIFTFHGDSVAVALVGNYAQDRYIHADSNGASIVHVLRPNVWFKFDFITPDSAIVTVNARDRIRVARVPE